MIEIGIVTLLEANAGVSALVAVGSILPLALPPGFAAYPAITYEAMPSRQVILLSGEVGEQSARVRLKCHSLKYTEAGALAKAVHAALDEFTGPLSDGTIIQCVEPSSGQDFYNSSTKVYGKVTEFIFHFD